MSYKTEDGQEFLDSVHDLRKGHLSLISDWLQHTIPAMPFCPQRALNHSRKAP